MEGGDGREDLFFLDYFTVLTEGGHIGWAPEDRREYLEASKQRDEQGMSAARERRDLKDVAYALKAHRCKLEEAYHSYVSERIRKKHRWLMAYHNRSFRHDLEYI